MKKVLVTLCVAASLGALSLMGCASTGGASAGSEARVAAYIRTWPLNAANNNDPSTFKWWQPDDIHGEYLTDLILAFALIDPNDLSSLYIKDADPKLWDNVAALKKKFPHLKVTFSVGGYGADGFSDMAADDGKRAAFVANCMTWLKEHDLDGVDIDWEYPVGPDWGLPIKTAPADAANFVTLLQDLRAAEDALGAETGKKYTLGAAIPASGWYPQKNKAVTVAKICDTVKLMSYDYYGGWMKTTGHAANLYNAGDTQAWSTSAALLAYVNALVPTNKISLGIGLYGQGWTGVPDNGKHGLFQPGASSIPPEELGWSDVKKLLEPGSGYTRYWDDAAKAPYLYNGDRWITYTDAEAIRYMNQFVKERGMAGVFVWEYAFDMDADLIRVMADDEMPAAN